MSFYLSFEINTPQAKKPAVRFTNTQWQKFEKSLDFKLRLKSFFNFENYFRLKKINEEKSTLPNYYFIMIFILSYFSGIHAREWISPATATYIMRELAENKNNADLIDFFDFYILPVANPDG